MLEQLVHNGILVPESAKYLGLTITIRNEKIKLNAKQEEMAVAWARKQGTPYVEDLVFVRNFLTDFCKALNLNFIAKIDEVDFSSAIDVVEHERAIKANMTKEEKKALAAERKEIREELKLKYGYATVNGEVVELANYMTEPSGIFMGRGKHPLRGRWKEGAAQQDVTLNLSPDAPTPDGEFMRIWQPDSMWIARWEDKLSGKLKYIWLHDTAPIKQTREAQKFDKAIELDNRISEIRQHIENGLLDDNAKRKRIATACYLIDVLCLRVGDEKDPDEADTVGATTLRPEHVKFHDNRIVEFRFLGKDSVLWHKKIELSDVGYNNLKQLVKDAKPSVTNGQNRKKHSVYNKPQIFPDVSSRNVNAFLSEAMKGLTAKVFRTHHASHVVKDNLDSSNVTKKDPEYRKWEAVVNANMAAAILCNHTKQPTQNWESRKERYKERETKAKERIEKIKNLSVELKKQLVNLRAEFADKKTKITDAKKKKAMIIRYSKRIESLKDRIEKTKEREEKAQMALGKLRVQKAIASKNRTWNLGTSQKSYIDPRVFYNWGKVVDYDVIDKYYATTLRRKFMWVKNEELVEDDS